MEKLKFPDRIEAALSKLFPNTQIATSLTPQGEVFIKVYENGVELNPPCISDGFYKVLAILAAIELRPSLLAIDEIENSLHAKTLEYIIDELKSSGVTVVLTTHSPVVVDMVDLEDLLIVEKTAEGTRLTSVKEPEEVRKKLKELDITQSESWLYGEFTE
jgi:predicted ATPase